MTGDTAFAAPSDIVFGGRAPESGFTLVEVVVAMVIMSLLMLATLSALRTIGNTQASVDRLVDRVDEVRSVSGFLRDSLEGSAPGSGGGVGLRFGGNKEPVPSYFKGTEDSFQWKAFVLFGESYGGAMLLRVYRDEGRLMLQWQRPPVPVESAKWSGQPSRVLVADLEEFQVAYWREYDAPAQARWSLQGTPALVSMNIKSAGRYWPELIVQVPR